MGENKLKSVYPMTPKEQAEQLARKCAEAHQNEIGHPERLVLAQCILRTIPLQSLLEVAKAAEEINGVRFVTFKLRKSLQALREQGIEL